MYNPADQCISWRSRVGDFDSPPTFDQTVQVFREQVWGWQLHVAEMCLNGGKDQNDDKTVFPLPHSAFAAMQIMCSYFEMIANYRDGYCDEKGNQSGAFFKRGLIWVFPELASAPIRVVENVKNVFWKQLRCGLYHGLSTGGIILSGDVSGLFAIDTQGHFWLNPHHWPIHLKSHLITYCDQLNDPSNTDLRGKFAKRLRFDNAKAQQKHA